MLYISRTVNCSKFRVHYNGMLFGGILIIIYYYRRKVYHLNAKLSRDARVCRICFELGSRED